MTFLLRLVNAALAHWTLWLVAGLFVTSLLIRAWSPVDKPRVRMYATLTGLHVAAIIILAALIETHYDSTSWEIAALAFALLASVGMGLMVAFHVLLPRVGLLVPRILTDLFAAAGFVVVMIIVGQRAGFSVAGLITTSAVVTAVIGFSLQDTLGNIMGGLALQLDNSIRVGDWVSLGVGQVNGQVTEIRWRYTAIETRNWETMIVPNSVLMKNSMVVLGKRSSMMTRWRRTIEFYVDFRTAPNDVLKLVQDGIRADPPPGCATDPAPRTQFVGMRDTGYGVYWIRYWMHDFTSDDGCDSEVRTRLYYIMRRAGIPFSIPAQALFLTEDTPERRARKLESDGDKRTSAISKVALFDRLPAEVRTRLAADLRYAPFSAGEVIVREGAEDGQGLYMISSGRAVVRVGEGASARVLATLEGGKFFGEMSLITGARRSATVVAESDLVCYGLDRATFHSLLKDHPDLAEHFAEILATRQAELVAVHGEVDEVSRHRQEANKHDLLHKIRALFGPHSQ